MKPCACIQSWLDYHGVKKHLDQLLSQFAATLAEERERWALWLPVFLGSGIALYFALPAEPAPFWAVATLLPGLILTWRLQSYRFLGWALLSLAVGFSLALARSNWVAAPLLAERLGPLAVEGTLAEIETSDGGTRLLLSDLTIEGLPPQETPRFIRLRAGKAAESLMPGSRLSAWAELLPPPRPAEPGAFDFGRQAYFDQLGAVGFSYGTPDVVAEGLADGWALWWSRLRQDISLRVRHELSGDAGGVADALISGERGALSAKVEQAFRDSSLAHLLSISGLHVSLVAALIFFVVRAGLALIPAVALNFNTKKWAAVVAASFMPFYLLLVGAAVPTQRACFMVLIVLLAVLVDRRALSMRLIAWAAVVVLVLQPEALLSASFQMSFAAVAALIAAHEKWDHRKDKDRDRVLSRLWLYVIGILLSSVIASLATGPFAVFHFNRMALYGVAANLIAVPISSFWIMPWILLSYLLMPFGLEGLVLPFIGWGCEAVIWVAEEVAALPGASLAIPAMPAWGLIVLSLGGLWLFLWSKTWRYWGLAPIVIGAISPLFVSQPQLLVSGDAKVLAITDETGRLWLSTSRAGRFSAETWLRRRAQDEVFVWEKPDEGLDRDLRCDALGCIYSYQGQEIALIFNPQAIEEDCARANLVVSLEPLPDSCAAPIKIDRFDLWRKGTHTIRFKPDGVIVESVADSRGLRPWNPKKGRRLDPDLEESD